MFCEIKNPFTTSPDRPYLFFGSPEEIMIASVDAICKTCVSRGVAMEADLAENGQIATQYVDLDGNPTADVHFNPNGSIFAVEGITSPDGRVLGKMGHSERIGKGLYRNVPGEYDMKLFAAAVRYFK